MHVHSLAKFIQSGNSMKVYRIIPLLLYFLLIYSKPLYAQQNYKENSLNEKKWKELSDGLDYSEEKKTEDKKPQKEKQPVEHPDWNLAGLAPFIKILGFICIIAIIAFLIAKLLPGLLYKNSRITKSLVEIETEENLQEENISEWPLQNLLNKYITEGDIRNAIRVYYLMSLQLLHLNGYIKWEKDKTNSKYVLEFSSHPQIQDFSNLTRLYETTWYGNFIPDETVFAVAKNQFILFNTQFPRPDEK